MTERRLLQALVILLCAVPLSAGAAGVIAGPAFLGSGIGGGAGGSVDLDSHLRYLSGLLLAIGLVFLSCVPGIERKGGRFRLATALVAVGGLARLGSLAAVGAPSAPHLMGLGLELVGTPLLALWQARIARRA